MQERCHLELEFYDRVARDPGLLDFLQADSLDGTWLIDLDTGDCWVSTRLRTLLGATSNTPAAWDRFVHPEDLARSEAELAEHLADPSAPLDLAIRCDGGTGQTRRFRCRRRVLRDANGRPTRVLAALTEVTASHQALGNDKLDAARRMTEEAKAANDTLIANVSHDLRGPLGNILGMTEVLLDDRLPPAHRELLEGVRRSADRVLHLVDDVLDASKIRTGRLPIRLEPCSLRDVASGALHDLRPLVDQRGVQLVLDVHANVPQRVRADGGRIRQVLHHLAHHAVTFTPSATVSVALRSTGDERIHFSVGDTGIGVPLDVQADVFDPFVRVDEEQAGAGLGLAICQRIVEAMGGVLDLVPGPGIGSTFEFTLALHALDAPLPTPSPRPVAVDLQPYRILLAEDNLVNQRVARAYLRMADHEVTVVDNGLDAVRVALEGKTDLVLLDLRMPTMDGFAAAERIRQVLPSRELPIVALTALATSAERREAQRVGIQEVLVRPQPAEALLATIDKHLRGHGVDDARTLAEWRVELGGDDEIPELLAELLAELDLGLEGLDLQRSPDEIRRVAHRLRSTAGAMRAEALRKQTLHVERFARDGRPELAEAVHAARHLTERARARVEAMLHEFA